jgi:RNA polymerase sigma-70 factor (ECF subfamily)
MAGGIEAVFLKNREVLLRFLRARGATTDAEDLLQELWLKVSAAPARPIAEPLGYLYRMANNLMLDQRRSEQRCRVREFEWTTTDTARPSGVADVTSAERVLVAREQVKALEDALASLGERTEMIFRRYRLDGVSQQEIARELSISLSAVEKHLQRAYRALVQLRGQLDAE